MKELRVARMAGLLKRELAEIVLGETDDERFVDVEITSVSVSRDGRTAKVHIAPVAGDPGARQTLAALTKAEGYFRRLLAESLDLPHVPALHFELDRGEQNRQRVETLLERAKKRSGGLVLLVLLAAWPGAVTARATSLERFEASAAVMGTTFRVAAYGQERSTLGSAVFAALSEARRVDALLSNYKPDSELSRVNQEAARRPAAVSAEFAALLDRCQDYSRKTEGAFDITVGPLMEAWGFFRGDGALPSRWTLRRVIAKVGYQHLEIDLARSTVRFAVDGMSLDPGGIGKGYAVGRMAALLKRYGVERAMISAGTSSMYAIGAPPEEPRGWRIRIRHPLKPDETVATLYLKDESFSTSGSTEKFFEAGGKRYSHIMDPRTGMPAQGILSVSVRSAEALDSEAWTTAFFVNGAEWTGENRPEGFEVFLCPEGSPCRWLGREAAP